MRSRTAKKSILLIEDEQSMAHALELKLKNCGIEVTCATQGEEGLTRLNGHSYDLILLDLVMPRMDGFAFLTALKSRGIKTPVIVLTNLSQEEDAKEIKKLGAHGYFVKSDTSLVTLITEITTFLKL